MLRDAHRAEGGVREQRNVPQEPLPSKLLPAAQVGLWAEATAETPGRSRGPAAVRMRQEGYFDAAVDVSLPEPLPKPRTAQGLWTAHPQTPQNLLLETVLPFREMRSSSVELHTGTSPPSKEAVTGHPSNPIYWGQTPQLRRTGTLRTFFFLLNHSFYSPYIL